MPRGSGTARVREYGNYPGLCVPPSPQERCDGCREPVRVVEPGVVTCPRLHDEHGVAERLARLGHRPGRAVHVELSGEQQYGGFEAGERRTSVVRREGPLGCEEGDGLLVVRPTGRLVLPRRGVPPAVEEGADGLPVAAGSLGDRLQGGVRGREPRLVPAKPSDFTSRLPGDRDPEGPGARGDQGEPADVLRVTRRVLRREVRSGRVAEQIDPGSPRWVRRASTSSTRRSQR